MEEVANKIYSTAPCFSETSRSTDHAYLTSLGLPTDWIENQCFDANGRQREEFRGLSPAEYYWTPDNFLAIYGRNGEEEIRQVREVTGGCFYSKSLSEQCSELGIAMHYINADRSGQGRSSWRLASGGLSTPEEVVLERMRAEGWSGHNDEWRGPLSIFNDVLTAFRSSRGVRSITNCERTMGVVGYQEYCDGAMKAFRKVSDENVEKLLVRNFRKHGPRDVGASYRGLNEKDVVGYWRALGRDYFLTLWKQHLELERYGGVGMGAGGADLTLWRDEGNQIVHKYVEVKTTDKLGHRQAYFLRNFVLPLKWDYSIVVVRPDSVTRRKTPTSSPLNTGSN